MATVAGSSQPESSEQMSQTEDLIAKLSWTNLFVLLTVEPHGVMADPNVKDETLAGESVSSAAIATLDADEGKAQSSTVLADTVNSRPGAKRKSSARSRAQVQTAQKRTQHRKRARPAEDDDSGPLTQAVSLTPTHDTEDLPRRSRSRRRRSPVTMNQDILTADEAAFERDMAGGIDSVRGDEVDELELDDTDEQDTSDDPEFNPDDD